MHEHQSTPSEQRSAAEDRGVIARVRMAANGGRNGTAAPALEQQIAALAAQVRNLGVRLANAGSVAAANEPKPARRARSQPAGREPYGRPATAGNATTLPASSRSSAATSASVIAMAEAAASEIRANAELEAQRIRDAMANASNERLVALLEIVGRQCDSVAALTTELDRVEVSTATLRSQAVALNGELQGMLVALSAVARNAR